MEVNRMDENEDKDPGVVVHVSPSYPPGCIHEWVYFDSQENDVPSHCAKCGMSFTRYIFTECP
jgi:hypothetical protein